MLDLNENLDFFFFFFFFFFFSCESHFVSGEQEIPGLTDKTVPRRLGPKRASKIRRLFNLSKEDDVRQYVVRRPLAATDSKLDFCNVRLM